MVVLLHVRSCERLPLTQLQRLLLKHSWLWRTTKKSAELVLNARSNVMIVENIKTRPSTKTIYKRAKMPLKQNEWKEISIQEVSMTPFPSETASWTTLQTTIFCWLQGQTHTSDNRRVSQDDRSMVNYVKDLTFKRGSKLRFRREDHGIKVIISTIVTI